MKIRKDQVEKLEIINAHFKERFSDRQYRELMDYTRRQIEEVYLSEETAEEFDAGKLALFIAHAENDEEVVSYPMLLGGLVSFAIDDGVLERAEIV